MNEIEYEDADGCLRGPDYSAEDAPLADVVSLAEYRTRP